MLFRFDLTEDEARHARWLSDLCRAVSRPDFVDAVRFWDAFRLTMLSQRVIVMKPAEKLEDFVCLYYGDELQERFCVDFSGMSIAEILETMSIQHTLKPYLLVYQHKVPHIGRVLRTMLNEEGLDYTRIIHPVLAGERVRLLVAILSFHDET